MRVHIYTVNELEIGMATEVGSRVGAILSADDKEIKLIGYGTYEGKELYEPLGFPNPKIKLDNGKIVWGCECWWGPEDKIKAKVEEYAKHATVTNVDIDEIRKEVVTEEKNVNSATNC